MTQADNPAIKRSLALDRLRTAMMCVVMFGHAMLPYVTSPRRFKDPAATVYFDWIGIFLYSFAMPAFFVTAGFAAGSLYRNRGRHAFWQHRWWRLGVPLLVGYLVLTPLTRAAYEFAQLSAQTVSLGAGWEQVRKGDWLRWSKLYHLWFLASLILFSAMAVALRPLVSRLPRLQFQSPLAATLVLFIGSSLPMSLSYISGTGQGTDAWMQSALFLYFGFGWWLCSQPMALSSLSTVTRSSLAGALLVAPVCVWATQARLHNENSADWVMGTTAGLGNAALGALATIGLIGGAHRWLQGESRFADYLGRASYWIYLVHYPVVIAVGGMFSVLNASAWVKYLLTVGVAVPIIIATFELSRRLAVLRTARSA